MLMYYLSLKPGLWKTFGTPFDAFWCCTGTGVEEYAKTNDTIYFHDADGVCVNLFIASELSWPEKKVRIVQDTDFPEEPATTLTIKTAATLKMPLRIRVPYWVDTSFAVKVNGTAQTLPAVASTYVTLDREWHDGDKIEVSLPMSLHVAPIPDDPTLQAMMYGPLVLAGRLGTSGLTKDMIYGHEGPDGKATIPVPEISSSGKDATSWVEPLKDKRLAFRTTGQSTNVELIPLYKLFDERYTVYWKVNTKSA